MAETNQVLLNYYKKEEAKKVKEMAIKNTSLKEILQNINMLYITKEEILEILGQDYEVKLENEELEINKETDKIKETPMEIARQYKQYLEQYNYNRELICTSKNISNGVFQRYLRLNYLIPELQLLVDNEKLGVKSAEHISFLDEENQNIITKIIQDYNYEISESIANKTKKGFILCKNKQEKYILNKRIIDKYKTGRKINVIFTEVEVNKYFKGIATKQIKQYIIGVLENTLNV